MHRRVDRRVEKEMTMTDKENGEIESETNGTAVGK
jgi:hypothetical protein